jgi:hypothetical protein
MEGAIMRLQRPARLASLACGVLLVLGGAARAEPRDPAQVAAAIDKAINQRLAKEKIPASPRTEDAEFLRRLYLDLTGKIPTAEKAAAFLDSKDPDKRAKLIDELLASPDYGRNFAVVWRDVLIKREDANRALNKDGFVKWLAERFNANDGWDDIVTELLTADGPAPQALFFAAHKDNNQFAPNKLVGTVGNAFLGVQIQCAECHCHPFVKKWNREDFWGLAAFFSQVRVTGVNVAETGAAGPARAGGVARPMGNAPAPKGAVLEIPDPVDSRKKTGKIAKAKFFEGEEPKLAEKPPYRAALAEWLTSTENRFFAPAAVNRLWFHFTARGIVNPIDDFQEDNKPSHPELLELLADEFRASEFDLKHLIRCIARSETYQRSCKPAKGNETDGELFSHQAVKVMSPEVLYDALTQGLGVTDLERVVAGGARTFGGVRGGAGSTRQQFVDFFTTGEETDVRGEFGLGIPQFLRLMNQKQFNEGGSTLDRLLKESLSREQMLERLYLTTLSRRPTADEVKKMTAYLDKKGDPKNGYAGVLWVLLNSAEFICYP